MTSIVAFNEDVLNLSSSPIGDDAARAFLEKYPLRVIYE
jgi:hypothetical protein